MADYSAGVLFYYKSNGTVFFLLGKDRRGKWSDFGGKCEQEDFTINETAAREFYEETVGIVMNKFTVSHILKNNCYVIGRSYLNKPYYMFISEMTYKIRYTEQFKESYRYIKSILGNNSPFCEKIDIQWISKDNIEKNLKSEIRQVFYTTFTENLNNIMNIINKTCV